jgi:hypothetical protein
MYQRGSHWTDFSRHLTLGTFKKICPSTPNLVKIWQKISRTLHEDLSVFHIAGSDIHSATTRRTSGLTSTATLYIFITLLTAKYVQQYKENALSRFHSNKG